MPMWHLRPRAVLLDALDTIFVYAQATARSIVVALVAVAARLKQLRDDSLAENVLFEPRNGAVALGGPSRT